MTTQPILAAFLGGWEIILILAMVLILGLSALGGIIFLVKSNNMATQKVKVANRQDLETSISSYIAKGFVVMNKTETSAMLTKKKEFSIPIGIIGFLLCFVGLIVYAIVYACQKDQVVEIVIT